MLLFVIAILVILMGLGRMMIIVRLSLSWVILPMRLRRVVLFVLLSWMVFFVRLRRIVLLLYMLLVDMLRCGLRLRRPPLRRANGRTFFPPARLTLNMIRSLVHWLNLLAWRLGDGVTLNYVWRLDRLSLHLLPFLPGLYLLLRLRSCPKCLRVSEPLSWPNFDGSCYWRSLPNQCCGSGRRRILGNDFPVEHRGSWTGCVASYTRRQSSTV